MATIFVGKIYRSWMCEYCGFKKKVNDNIVLHVFIICQKLFMNNIGLYMTRNDVNSYGTSCNCFVN